jgi:hypothetical protein
MTSDEAPRELETALDGLIQRFGDDETEARAARSEFEARTGRVFEEDECFEARTVAFLEWFVLERVTHEGTAPVVQALRETPHAPLAPAWRAWARSHRSVFAVEAQAGGVVRLVDLFGGGLFAVDERRRMHGVSPGDVLDARVVGWRGRVRFGRTFLFHPAGARAAIVGHAHRVREAGGTRADFADHIASLQIRALRYKHVVAERVYEASSGEVAARR